MDVKYKTDVELARMFRSAKTSSNLLSKVREEMRYRGMFHYTVNNLEREKIKRIKDYDPELNSRFASSHTFEVGDKVVKNSNAWEPNAFDSWGRGEGIGEIVEPPFDMDYKWEVDVCWPNGRCFENPKGLLPFDGTQEDYDRLKRLQFARDLAKKVKALPEEKILAAFGQPDNS